MVHNRFEGAILSLIVLIVALDRLLISLGTMSVDWNAYIPGFSLGLGLVLLGQFYRLWRKDERLAATLIGAGAFILFSLVGALFNYLLLPVKFPLIDEQLLVLDAAMGYSWQSMVEWAAEHPTLSLVLRYVYFSSLPQLIITVLVLGFTGRLQSLWEFLTVGIFGVMLCMVIWFFFPSLGPTTLMTISRDVVANASLGVTPAYGAELLRLAEFGETFLTPTKVLGLIAFPSFHTVMALMAVTYLWQVPYLRWVALAINIMMIPAILIHGGHYAVDLAAGLVVFIVTYQWVKRLRYEKSII